MLVQLAVRYPQEMQGVADFRFLLPEGVLSVVR
jgi:hypothetical protein